MVSCHVAQQACALATSLQAWTPNCKPMLPCRREDSADGYELSGAAAKPSSSVVSSLTDLHPSRSQRRTRYTVRSITTWHSANMWYWKHPVRHVVWDLRFLCRPGVSSAGKGPEVG